MLPQDSRGDRAAGQAEAGPHGWVPPGLRLAERTAERMNVDTSIAIMMTRSVKLARVTPPAIPAKPAIMRLVPMHTARRPGAARPYRRLSKFRTPARAMAIPDPKNQTLPAGVADESRNVVTMWRQPTATIAAAINA